MAKGNKGFIFTEVMVAASIFTFIAAAMYGVLVTGRRSWLTGEALLNSQQSARIGLDKMTREIHLASRVGVAADNRSVEFEIPIDADGDGWLDLLTGTSTIVYGAQDIARWKIRYRIDASNEQIVREILDTTSIVANQSTVARNIKVTDDTNPTILLTYFETATGGTGDTNEAVNIGLTTEVDSVQGRTISPPIQMTLRTRVNLRN